MNSIPFATVLTMALLAPDGVALSQGHPRNGLIHGHGALNLFVAQLTGNKVVPASTSSATATGAFVLDRSRRTVTYELTFHGLEHGAPQTINLHNFAEGGRGSEIHAICGNRYKRCPIAPSGNVTGTWSGERGGALDGELLGELASGRIYVEIIGRNGKPEIRGQLEPNNAMVPVQNYAAHLVSVAGTGSPAVGTAVLSEVHLPGGRVSVFYHVTVAHSSGVPRRVALTGETQPSGPSAMGLPSRNDLPHARLLPSRATVNGGTLTGEYEARADQSEPVLATRLRQVTDREVGIVIATDGFPGGELFGVLKLVH